jgi:hypothetical protein
MRKWVTELGQQATGRVRDQNLRRASGQAVEALAVSSMYAVTTSQLDGCASPRYDRLSGRSRAVRRWRRVSVRVRVRVR